MKHISILIPTYNENVNVKYVFERIQQVMQSLPYTYEIIFVDDGSIDDTLSYIKYLASFHQEVLYIEFSRNFGHQYALKAAIDFASGDACISLDCDLQHPPELITDMLHKWEEGYDIVYTKRISTQNSSISKKMSSKWFYKFMNLLSDTKIEEGVADFRLLNRQVTNLISNIREYDIFMRGFIAWIGFKQYALEYHAHKRVGEGGSKYTLKKMLRLALSGVTSFSLKPLHTALYIGGTLMLLSLMYIPYIIYSYYTGHVHRGWVSILSTVVFLGGTQIFLIGIIGLYVGKIFMQVKKRPNYIIRSTNIRQ